MEGINHSSRERHSWSDRGRKRDKNVLSPFGSQATLLWPFATLCPVPLPPFGLFKRAPPRPAFALCAHWQHSIIRPRQLQPARLTTEEFDVLPRRAALWDSSYLPPPFFFVCVLLLCLFLLRFCPVGQSSTLSSGPPAYWELIGGRVSFESVKSSTTVHSSRSRTRFLDWTLISSLRIFSRSFHFLFGKYSADLTEQLLNIWIPRSRREAGIRRNKEEQVPTVGKN